MHNLRSNTASLHRLESPLLIWNLCLLLFLMVSCQPKTQDKNTSKAIASSQITAKDILGNPDYLAISYGGYRQNSRDVQPTVEELKEDMRILAAMNVRILRTYNTKLPHAANVIKAIDQIKEDDPTFEMYVMLGAWIDCKGAWTAQPDHENENEEANAAEIQRAVELATKYPDIVKIIAVGNEAMVKWAAAYYVQPTIILKWVEHLQELKESGDLPENIWITSSDNFASWGGGGEEYHVDDLEKLIAAVDYISMHTYPMHDTHYNPEFWGVEEDEENLSDKEKIKMAMDRSLAYAQSQYNNTVNYMRSLGMVKPVHIGETGWASSSNGFYGPEGSKACDEYKEGLYYHLIREWTNKEGISCFYFEAFDEVWKDAQNPGGSENHFGLFDLNGRAKYALWELVDEGVFEGQSRGGNTIVKTYGGDIDALMRTVEAPPKKPLATTVVH